MFCSVKSSTTMSTVYKFCFPCTVYRDNKVIRKTRKRASPQAQAVWSRNWKVRTVVSHRGDGYGIQTGPAYGGRRVQSVSLTFSKSIKRAMELKGARVTGETWYRKESTRQKQMAYRRCHPVCNPSHWKSHVRESYSNHWNASLSLHLLNSWECWIMCR